MRTIGLKLLSECQWFWFEFIKWTDTEHSDLCYEHIGDRFHHHFIGSTHSFNIPTASSGSRGLLSSAGSTAFNNKLSPSAIGSTVQAWSAALDTFASNGSAYYLNANNLTRLNPLINSYVAASTTIPKTYSANVWNALQTFGNNISFGGATLSASALSSGQFLKYNGTNWINSNIANTETSPVSELLPQPARSTIPIGQVRNFSRQWWNWTKLFQSRLAQFRWHHYNLIKFSDGKLYYGNKYNGHFYFRRFCEYQRHFECKQSDRQRSCF